MALVLKIKHKETLRRWVVSQTLPENSSDFSLTVRELELKVRELFHFAVNDVLVITYVDKEGDVVTLADDQDLVDACIVQGINPLRLEVKRNGQESSAESVANIGWHPRSSFVHDSNNGVGSAYTTVPPPNPKDNGNSERPSKHAFPQATAEAIKQFVEKHTKSLDPNLQPAVLIKNIQKALKDFVQTLVREGQRLAPRGGPAYAPCASESPVHLSSMDTVHHGVRCDGCNLYPIKGLRYKSSKVFNYDLCSTCFDKMGNVSDYQKIEKPVKLTCHGFLHSSPTNGKMSMKWTTPFASGSEGWKSECPFLHTPSGHPTGVSKQLDGSFVKDVSVFDTAELAPGVHFTRMLRLKNIGSLPWPQGTLLVHIGGDMFALESTIDLKLPETGLAVDLEFDICVNMRAPEKSGNYISHWSLMVPNGERFGQSFWIAIQVVGEMNGPSRAQAASKMDDVAPVVEETRKIESEDECPPVSKVDDSGSVDQSKGLVGSDKADEVSRSVKLAAESPQFIVSAFMDGADSVTDEEDGFSMIEKPVDTGSFKMARAPLVTSQVAIQQPISVIQEQYARMSPSEIVKQVVNLHELELMGFTNHNLNAMLLEKNNQDLQLTLDDLLLGSGWDNLLKDLEEMGFEDANTNLRLLIQNEGSIKRVVKELVELEKLKVEV